MPFHIRTGKCDIDVRRELYNNIVLSGGTSMFEGIQARLQKEVSDMAGQVGGTGSVWRQARHLPVHGCLD